MEIDEGKSEKRAVGDMVQRYADWRRQSQGIKHPIAKKATLGPAISARTIRSALAQARAERTTESANLRDNPLTLYREEFPE